MSKIVYPIEKYKKNKGSVGKKKIVCIGASYRFVHKVFRDMLLVDGFNDCEIVINDIDEVPLKLVGDLVEKMARQAKTKVKVVKQMDQNAALKDADIVLLCITVGGQESDFRSFEVCSKYGIPVTVGDTMGPCALARCLREIPVVVSIARKMEKLCPKALMLNFSNPMSVITGAMARYSSIPVYGLCHSADGLQQYFADVFKCSKENIKIELGGVNHQSFVTKLKVKNKDVTGDIFKFVEKSKAKIKDGLMGVQEDAELSLDIYRILKAFPSCSAGHLAEFYGYFFHPKHIGKLEHEIKKIIPGRKPFGRSEPIELIKEWTYGPKPVGDMDRLTTEHAHELMWSFLTGESYTRSLNILNKGEYIKDLPLDACVEIMATTKGRKVSANRVKLPPAVHSIVQRWATIHDLSIKAAMNFDRDAAHQALFLDAHMQDMYDIPSMLDDFLKALEPWMSGEWYK